jgi:hypothetical protein
VSAQGSKEGEGNGAGSDPHWGAASGSCHLFS